jgi:hypothetical protein
MHGKGTVMSGVIVVSPAGWCLIAGIILLVFSGVALTYVLRRRGQVRRKTNDEVVDRMFRWDPEDQASYAIGKGTGVRIEAQMDLNDMREAAAQGDWGLFWSFPICFACFGFGVELMALALSLHDGDMLTALLAALGCVPIGLVGPFMAWAALYTDIDRRPHSPPKDAWRQRS